MSWSLSLTRISPQAQAAWQDELFNRAARDAAAEARELQRGIDRDVENVADQLSGIRPREAGVNDAELASLLEGLKGTQARMHAEAEARRLEAEATAIHARNQFNEWRDTSSGRAFVRWCEAVADRCKYIFTYHQQWDRFYHLEATAALAVIADQRLAEKQIQDASSATSKHSSSVAAGGAKPKRRGLFGFGRRKKKESAKQDPGSGVADVVPAGAGGTESSAAPPTFSGGLTNSGTPLNTSKSANTTPPNSSISPNNGEPVLTGEQAATIAEIWDADQRKEVYGYDPLAPGAEPPGPWVIDLSVYFGEVEQTMMRAFSTRPAPPHLPKVPIPTLKTNDQLVFAPMRPYLELMRENLVVGS